MKSAVMSMTATPDRSYAGSPTMVWLVFKERILLPLRQATHSKQRKARFPTRASTVPRQVSVLRTLMERVSITALISIGRRQKNCASTLRRAVKKERTIRKTSTSTLGPSYCSDEPSGPFRSVRDGCSNNLVCSFLSRMPEGAADPLNRNKNDL